VADPYETLGLTRQADAAAVRRRYLELVRQHPPDRSPERFAAIRAAYEQLQDPIELMHKRLFDVSPEESLNDILADLRAGLRTERIPVETLLSLAER
jgi:curved DNA-binding protein CbpA